MGYNSLHGHIMERRWDMATFTLHKHPKFARDSYSNRGVEYPIHIALKLEAPDDVIMSILKGYPEVVQISDKDGKFPLELAKSKRYSKAVVLAIKSEVLKRTGGRRSRRSSLRRNSSSYAVARASIAEVLKEVEPSKEVRFSRSTK